MDEPARKRRRTNSPEEAERQSSPLRKPPRRPSFASPTKASLARNYPNLLPPASAKGENSGSTSRGETLARGKQARAFVLGEDDIQGDLEQAALGNAGESSTAIQRQPKGTPRAGRITGHKATPTSRHPVDEDEGNLPTTPSQRGLQEQDIPRRGVLFSSPSKRPPRVKDPVKQSSLKTKSSTVQVDNLAQSTEDRQDKIQEPIATETEETPDPQIEAKKHEKAQLQRELEQLEAHVSRFVEEITKEQQRAPEQSLRPTEQSDLTDLIIKTSGTNTEDEQPTLVSNLLCSFLPFSAFVMPRPHPSQPEKPVPSHQPVDLQDPSPFLQMFTSLKFSTRLGLPRGKVLPSSNRVYQKHAVDIVGPQKLLTAQVSVVINALANEVAEMHIVRLSSWAERELGVFVRSKAKEKDVGNACWAIDSYWALAHKRAEYWSKCQTAFAHLIAGHTDEDTENAHPQTKATQIISRKDLNRQLGRDTLVLQDKHVLLKLNWRISFDWTGEAASEITVEAAIPEVWQEADTRASFKKVPETFASLIRDKGVYEGTRIMVALLFAK